LAKIARTAKNPRVRSAAVEKLTDQVLLEKIAVNDKTDFVRSSAIDQITSQAALAKIAVVEKNASVRSNAVRKLTDQATLGKIAIADKASFVRRYAIEKLTDQAVLAEIATKEKGRKLRLAAVKRLTDQNALTEIATKEKTLDIRLAAIANMSDAPLLRQCAEKAPEAVIRRAAVERIHDDAFLLARLPAETSAAVRYAIVTRLQGKEALRVAARTAFHQRDRKTALRRLRNKLNDPAPDLVMAHRELARQVAALAGETDSGKLQELALTGAFDVLRIMAAKTLSDPAALEQVGRQSTSRDVLKIVLAKIEDKTVLDRIASTAADPAMQLAASHKAGAKSWTQIFNDASKRGASAQIQGNALAAVALFPSIQPEAKKSVQKLALSLIRLGDETRIPEMVDLLEGYGDKRLAEDYLNCGQPDLDSAGRRWGRRRGYNVGRGRGSHRATWGR
jgi:hypothetical protein